MTAIHPVDFSFKVENTKFLKEIFHQRKVFLHKIDVVIVNS